MLISKTLVFSPKLCGVGGVVRSFLGCLLSTCHVAGPFCELGIHREMTSVLGLRACRVGSCAETVKQAIGRLRTGEAVAWREEVNLQLREVGSRSHQFSWDAHMALCTTH